MHKPQSLHRLLFIKISVSVALVLLTFLTSCDPGHSGNSQIHNNSSYALKLNFQKYYNGGDSSLVIPANSKISFNTFGGLGAGRDFDCCVCESGIKLLEPTDTSKQLMKDVYDSVNWVLINHNKRKFDSHDISCILVINPSDIQ